jgi:hypothetical protein
MTYALSESFHLTTVALGGTSYFTEARKKSSHFLLGHFQHLLADVSRTTHGIAELVSTLSDERLKIHINHAPDRVAVVAIDAEGYIIVGARNEDAERLPLLFNATNLAWESREREVWTVPLPGELFAYRSPLSLVAERVMAILTGPRSE